MLNLSKIIIIVFVYSKISVLLCILRECKTQSDCVANNGVPCSICADGKIQEEKTQCLKIYEEVYENINDCKMWWPANMCYKLFNNCSGNGECYDMFRGRDKHYTMYPHCYCKPGYYGNKCEESKSTKDTAAITWFYDRTDKTINAFFVGQRSKEFFFLLATNPNKTTFSLYGENGFYEAHSGSYSLTGRHRCELTMSPIRGCYRYNISIRYPYKAFRENSKEMFTYKGNVLGYEGTLRFKVFMEFLVNDFPIKMFVSYNDTSVCLKCIADITFENCNNDADFPLIRRPEEHIIVKRSVNYYDDGKVVSKTTLKLDCAHEASTSWKIWRMGKKYRESYEEFNEPFLPEILRNKTLNLPPYTLMPARYKILNEVWSTSLDCRPNNFAYCHIVVEQTDIDAYIKDGDVKQAHSASGLNLEVIAEDRNIPTGQRQDLQYKWTCINCNDSSDDLCSGPLTSTTSICNVPPNELKADSLYIFESTITSRYNYEECDNCKTPLSKTLRVKVNVGSDSEPPPEPKYDIRIECDTNCEGSVVPHEPMILRAKSVEEIDVLDIIWSYSKDGETLKPADDIAEMFIRSDTLSIKPESLEPGSRYTIIASVVGKPNATAMFVFNTEDSIDVKPLPGDPTRNDPSPMQCHILPLKGIKGFDLFNIDCGRYSNYRFEFYDKSTEDANKNVIFSGRMLGTSFNGKLSNMRLTRDFVYIYVYNRNGMFSKHNVSVSIVERDYNNEVKIEIMQDLQTMSELGELSRLLGYISIIPDVISYNDVNEVKRIAKTLISAFGKTPPVNELADVKLFTSTIYNVLTSMSKAQPLELLPHRLLLITSTIHQQAAGLNNAIFDKESSRWLASSEAQVICKSLLDSLMAAIISRDRKYDNLNEEEIDIYLLDMIKRSTNKVYDTIGRLNEMLTYRQRPAQPPTSVGSSDSNIILWVMVNDKALRIFDTVEKYNIPVKISTSLQSDLESRMRKSEQLNLQVAYINKNIFWWCKSDVKSNLASVEITSRYKERRLSNIESQDPSMLILLDMNENLTDLSISGTTTQLDPDMLPFDLDVALKVLRLDPEPRSLIHLQFLFPQTTSTLKVFVSEDFRPDYAAIKSKSLLISERHPNYTLLDFISREQRTFLYMAILPGPEVDINESVNYTFSLNTKVCQLWVQGYWNSQSCQITSNTSGSTVHCMCSHFSIFAAAFPVPPQKADPYNDAMLFLTVLNNPLVVSVVLSMLLVFFTLLIILWFLDNRVKRFGHVIILNDNYVNDPYPYLIAVHTGSRFCSGTTANVGIKVHGTEGSSRPHVFYCDYRKLLQRNADDWFVIFTPNHLGDLVRIYLWHDNTGSSPDWYCEKVIVYNIEESEETVFLLGEWLSVHPCDPLPDCVIATARYTDIKDLKRTFLDNCNLGLREGHLLMSVISRHPRSEITRVQRISLLMTWVMVAMLCSIMFYRPSNAETRVDDYDYSVGTRELLVSIQSLIFSLVITFTVVFLFRSSYKNKFVKTKREHTLRVRRNSALFEDISMQTESDKFSNPAYFQRNERGKTMYQNVFRILSKSMQTRVLAPVTLPSSSPSLQRRTLVYVFAWLLCLTVVLVSAYLIMLFGLKLGAINSQKWLTSVLMTVSEDVFITGPFRIVIIAALLSITYRKLYEANVYDVWFDEVKSSRPPNTDKYLLQLFERRSLRMYMPLVENNIQEMVRKSQIRHNWWTLIDFVITLCFLLVLNAAVYRLWTSHYYCNENVKRLFTESHHPRLESIHFNDVSSILEAERYIETSFIHAVYSYRWYNGAPLKHSDTDYWDLTVTSRMFGLPLLRQIRVATFLCKNLIQYTGYCTPKWSIFSEDMDSYNTGWLPASWDTPYRSAWNYKAQTHNSVLTSYRLRGASESVYHTGGYTTTLGPRRQQAEHTLSELRAYHWQDHRTRALLLELTLYNVNVNMFSQVTLVVEYLVSDIVTNSVQVTSLKGYEPIGFWGLLYVALLVFYNIRIAYLVNRHGLLHNLSVAVHVLRILVVILAFLCVVLYLVHYFTSERFVRTFHGQEEDTNFDFDSFTLVFRSMQIVLSVLLCVAIVMFFTSVRGGRTFFTQVYTFTISWPWICWLTSLLSLFYVVLSRDYLLLNIVMLNAGSLDIFHPKAVNTRAFEDLESPTVRLFLILKTIIFFVFYSMFMLTFLHFSKVTKGYKFIRSHRLNFITFLCERLFRKKKKTENKLL